MVLTEFLKDNLKRESSERGSFAKGAKGASSVVPVGTSDGAAHEGTHETE